MRKSRVLGGLLIVCLAFGMLSVTHAASLGGDRSGVERVSRGELAAHRVMLDRLIFELRLAQSLGFVLPDSISESIEQGLGLTNDPDPTGEKEHDDSDANSTPATTPEDEDSDETVTSMGRA